MESQSQKLKEALDAKAEAVQAVEQARVRAMAAEGEAAKQIRAVTAEEQLEGWVTQGAQCSVNVLSFKGV